MQEIPALSRVMSTQSPLEKAVDAAGNASILARRLGVKRQSVQQWKKQIPAERVLEIERLTGVSRHELRPDLYPENEAA